jgi:GT2 family glycosyltransferase
MDEPRVSIIILNWNGKHFLKNCLDSALNQTYKNYEILLVDNASTDESAEFVKERYGREIRSGGLRILCNDRNYGFAEGNNIGIKYARRDRKLKYVVLLNNDTIVDERFLEELVGVAENDEKIGIVQSNILYPVFDGEEGDKKQVSIGGKRFYISEKRQKIENSGTTGILNYNIYNVRRTQGVGFYAGGASFLFNANIVQPPFDPDYFMYSEDVYFSWLVRMKGYDVGFAEKSYVMHLGGGWCKELKDPKLIFHSEKNRIMNLLLFYDRTTLLKILLLLFSEIFLKNLLYPRRTKSRIFGYLWILKNRHKIAEKRQSIQTQRRVPDEHILKLMSCKVMTESGAVSKIVNRLAYLYCLLLGIKTLESQR